MGVPQRSPPLMILSAREGWWLLVRARLGAEASAAFDAAAGEDFFAGAGGVAFDEAVFFLALALVRLIGSFGHMKFPLEKIVF